MVFDSGDDCWLLEGSASCRCLAHPISLLGGLCISVELSTLATEFVALDSGPIV